MRALLLLFLRELAEGKHSDPAANTAVDTSPLRLETPSGQTDHKEALPLLEPAVNNNTRSSTSLVDIKFN